MATIGCASCLYLVPAPQELLHSPQESQSFQLPMSVNGGGDAIKKIQGAGDVKKKLWHSHEDLFLMKHTTLLVSAQDRGSKSPVPALNATQSLPAE